MIIIILMTAWIVSILLTALYTLGVRVIVTVVTRINIRTYVKMEDSVAVQSERRETPECLVEVWEVSVPKSKAGKKPATPGEGQLENSCKDSPPKGGPRSYTTSSHSLGVHWGETVIGK